MANVVTRVDSRAKMSDEGLEDVLSSIRVLVFKEASNFRSLIGLGRLFVGLRIVHV